MEKPDHPFKPHIQEIIDDIEIVVAHPERPYPFLIIEASEYGKVRFTFFSHNEETGVVFAAIGQTSETNEAIQTRIQKAKDEGKWLFAAIKDTEGNYSVELGESSNAEFPDLFASLQQQGAFGQQQE